LSDLNKTLKQLVPKPSKKSIDLSTYRADRLADAPDGSQFIGFTAIDGTWYIVRTEGERMLYYFGGGDYESAWNDRMAHDYKSLSEATSGLRA
jgi:hypothetical protein